MQQSGIIVIISLETTMIRSVFMDQTHKTQYQLSTQQLNQIVADGNGLLWVDLDNPTNNELMEVLNDIFHFHPLTIEDCHSEGYQTPKVDDFESYLFIIAHALLMNPLDGDKLETNELDLFLGKNYLVTTHKDFPMQPVEMIWGRLEKDNRLMSHDPDFLCHAVLDVLVDEYMPLLDMMDEEIDALEDRVLEKPQPSTLQRILDLKHSTLSLRRIIAPQREVMNRLSRDDFTVIKPRNRIYFRDIYDHLVRIQDLAESVRDIVSGTLDIYLSATSNRLNEVMKALTIVSTIFLPLSFLAGVYGMNFKYFPEINWKLGYLFVWGLFITVAGIMMWYFKKKKWF